MLSQSHALRTTSLAGLCVASLVSCSSPLRPSSVSIDGSLMAADAAAPPGLDADVEANAPPPGTCRSAVSTMPTFFVGEPGSPCPATRPVGGNARCDPQLAYAFQCVYPSEAGATSESNCQCGEVTREPPHYEWFCKDAVCRREGDACLATWASNPREHEFELTSACDQRLTIPCEAAVTQQMALDESLRQVLTECGLGFCEMAATLSVFLDGGCVERFVLAPTEGFIDLSSETWLADCVRQKLDQVSFACAQNLVCGRGELYAVPSCL